MSERPERVGVFGGTFDPIHNGHIAVGANVRHALGLDRVLFVVANRPWQKVGRRHLTDASARLQMVAASVEDIDGLEASSLEIDRGGDTYTADTLEELSVRSSSGALFLIIGTDVAGELDTWRRVEVIRELATLAVVDRPGAAPVELPGWQVERVDVPPLEISSTELRRRVNRGLPVDGLVPPAAIRVIRDRDLYAETG